MSHKKCARSTLLLVILNRSTMIYPSVREIIYSLKPVDYLQLQTEKRGVIIFLFLIKLIVKLKFHDSYHFPCAFFINKPFSANQSWADRRVSEGYLLPCNVHMAYPIFTKSNGIYHPALS